MNGNEEEKSLQLEMHFMIFQLLLLSDVILISPVLPLTFGFFVHLL
jgi:hypothetical protein